MTRCPASPASATRVTVPPAVCATTAGPAASRTYHVPVSGSNVDAGAVVDAEVALVGRAAVRAAARGVARDRDRAVAARCERRDPIAASSNASVAASVAGSVSGRRGARPGRGAARCVAPRRAPGDEQLVARGDVRDALGRASPSSRGPGRADLAGEPGSRRARAGRPHRHAAGTDTNARCATSTNADDTAAILGVIAAPRALRRCTTTDRHRSIRPDRATVRTPEPGAVSGRRRSRATRSAGVRAGRVPGADGCAGRVSRPRARRRRAPGSPS
ncbi:MAG: hypothetical protein KatS3mg009_1679 [Acidimicrobiia bacterium]|nr:MAG: hypothetical protein KatS3mg009_1679 [Acidimicrobiia bacterium]